MLQKCLSITLADIFTNFEGIVFFCFFRVCLFKKGVNICNFSFGKVKSDRRNKIIFNFKYTWVSFVFSNDPFNYFSSIICVNNIAFW